MFSMAIAMLGKTDDTCQVEHTGFDAERSCSDQVDSSNGQQSENKQIL